MNLEQRQTLAKFNELKANSRGLRSEIGGQQQLKSWEVEGLKDEKPRLGKAEERNRAKDRGPNGSMDARPPSH